MAAAGRAVRHPRRPPARRNGRRAPSPDHAQLAVRCKAREIPRLAHRHQGIMFATHYERRGLNPRHLILDAISQRHACRTEGAAQTGPSIIPQGDRRQRAGA